MIIKAFKIITTVFIKSLLTSLYQREEFPSLVKRGKGRFSNQCQFNFETLNKKEAGFTLVELMITMVVFVFFIAAASQVFTGLLTQFKQQSKMAETNIEGMVGLEMLRQDIEGAGYGLPWYVEIDGDGDRNDWEQLTNYNETSANPFGLDDAPSGAPRAILSENDVTTYSAPNDIFNHSDYLVIKAVNVGRNDACNKWTALSSAFPPPYVKTWTPATENLAPNDRVIVLRPGSSDANARTLVVNGPAFSTTYGGVSLTPWRSTDLSETRLVYGVDPDTDLRMPFNRADYFIRRFDSGGANITPGRCAPNTGILEKATVNQNGGGFTYLPLLDCVADMQVIYALDNDEDGDFEDGTGIPPDAYRDDITTVPLTAQQIRKRVKQVRVYILSHEGQRDTNYTFTSFSDTDGDGNPNAPFITVGEFGLGRNFDLSTISNYLNYRWKVYTIVVKPNNLR